MRLGSRNRRQGDRRNRQMFLKRPGTTPGKSGQRKTCAGSRLLFLAEGLGKRDRRALRDGDHCRSHDGVIRVYDEVGNVIETHQHASESVSGAHLRFRAAKPLNG